MAKARVLAVLVIAMMVFGALMPQSALGASPNPNQPTNVSPVNATVDISLTPTLVSDNFTDPDAGSSHAASQWQITSISGDYSAPLFDSGVDDTSDLERVKSLYKLPDRFFFFLGNTDPKKNVTGVMKGFARFIKEAVEKLKALEVSLSYTKIYAPISGYVSAVTTQEGETVVSGLSAAILITIIDPSKLEMWIYVDETDIGRTKPGMKVEHWVDTYRDKRFYGKIHTIYPQPEIKDNIVYYLAIVKIDPKDTALLRPEMTTHVRIIVEEKTDVLIVPNGAVRFEEGKNMVYVRGKEKQERREVALGIRDDSFTEIVSGLAEGERIVITAVKKASPTVSPGPKK